MTKRPGYRSNATWMLMQAVLQRIIGAASTVVLARLLPPAGLGAYSITSTTANSAYGVARLGIDAGTHVLAASEEAGRSRDLDETLSAALGAFLLVGLAGAVACFALADVVATELFNSAVAKPYVQIAGALLFGQVVGQAAYTIFAGLHQFTAYVRVMLLGAPAIAAATIAGALSSGALGAAIFGALAQLIVGAVLLYASLRTALSLGVSIRPTFSVPRIREILRVGLPFYIAGLFYIPADYIAQALMVRGHGFAALGDLRVVLAITTIVSFLPNAIGGPMISAFSRAHQDAQGMDAVFWRTLRVVWTVALGASLMLGVVWPLLVRIFGDGYQQALLVGAMSLGYAIGACVRNVISNRLLSSGRQRWLLATAAIEAAAFVGLSIALIPPFGLAGYLVAQGVGAGLPSLLLFGAAALRGDMNGRALTTGGAVLMTAAGLLAIIWLNASDAGVGLRALAGLVGVPVLAAIWLWTMSDGAERGALVSNLRRMGRGR